jgi:enterochelin esterase family protein
MTCRRLLVPTLVGACLVAGAVLPAAEAPQQSAPDRKPGDYPLGPDSLPQPGVPQGRLEGPLEFRSRIIENTVRRYWVYVPAQYVAGTPANVLVFQDGQRATNPTGVLRVPQVLENLIHKKQIPVTIGIFITPGQRGDVYPDTLGTNNPNNRAAEYDSLTDAYTRFLVEEMLPEVGKQYTLASDPARRAIGGASSGAICAFTVAWHRPDQFRNVISLIGSYTSIAYRPARDGQPMVPGGDLYPTLIRKNPIKPIRIFLQDGSNDLDNSHGNWFLANQQVLAACVTRTRRPTRRRLPARVTTCGTSGVTARIRTRTAAPSCPTSCDGSGVTNRSSTARRARG